MKVDIKIVPNDTDNTVKMVLLDSKNRILLLKRSLSVKKFKNSWDLPGGHLRVGEDMISGLKREVFEELSLKIANPLFFKETKKKKGSFFFFYGNYDNQPISLSHEHTKYLFFDKKELSKDDKFQKIGLEILEKLKNEQNK